MNHVYVASSWKNKHYSGVVQALREKVLPVYDFKDPRTSFSWTDIRDQPFPWDPKVLQSVLTQQRPRMAFAGDLHGMKFARVGVLVLPCGRSAHMEAGYMVGRNVPVHIYSPEPGEPDNAHQLAKGYHTTLDGLVQAVWDEMHPKEDEE